MFLLCELNCLKYTIYLTIDKKCNLSCQGISKKCQMTLQIYYNL